MRSFREAPNHRNAAKHYEYYSREVQKVLRQVVPFVRNGRECVLAGVPFVAMLTSVVSCVGIYQFN